MQNVPVKEATAAPDAAGLPADTGLRPGAVVQTDGTTFTLWAPAAERVELALIADDGSQRNLDLAHTGEFKAVSQNASENHRLNSLVPPRVVTPLPGRCPRPAAPV